MIEIDEFGDKRWVNEKGLLHREGGPAVEYADGSKYWLQNGKIHRSDGPAVEYVSGGKEYWYCGEKHFDVKNNEEWDRIVRLMILG